MKQKESAGLVIIYRGMVLLAHTTGRKWWGSYGIPKGGIEPGESRMDAAIRETREEVGLDIPRSMIDPNPRTYVLTSRKYKYTKTVYWYVVEVEDLGQIGMKSLVVPKGQLQLEEVDWAGFMPLAEAKKRVMSSQQQLLTQLVGLGPLESHCSDKIYKPEQQKTPSSMKHVKLFEQFINEAAIKWQDAREGDSALVKDLNKLGLIVKAYGRKFHLKFPDGSDKTYDASELEFVTNEAVSEAESYRPGDMWSRDFDYDGMLQMGAEASIKTPIRDLEGLYKSMVDVNYHKEARHADAAIEALESGDKTTATKELKKLNKLCKQALEESLHESNSEAELVKKANQFKKELMQLKKDPKGNELRIAAKEEQLSRVAQAIRNARADKMGEAVTEAKDLRSLQKALDRLQNDYESVLDDETLDAMSELIMTVNSKL